MAGSKQNLKDELPLHIRSLYRYALALTRNDEEAHDLVQECCTAALDNECRYSPGTNLRAWLFTIMHNKHVSRLRNERRIGDPLPVEAAERLLHPSNQMSRLEFRDLVAALDRLDEEFREVLILVSVEGLSYREVSEVLDVPVGTVTSRLSRARSMLRHLMGGRDKGRARPASAGLRVVR